MCPSSWFFIGHVEDSNVPVTLIFQLHRSRRGSNVPVTLIFQFHRSRRGPNVPVTLVFQFHWSRRRLQRARYPDFSASLVT